MGGGGKGGKKAKPSPLERTMGDIATKQQARAEQLQTEFENPARQIMTPQIMSALGQNPFQTDLSAAERAPLETQFDQAKASLMNSGERGGRLRSQMAGLERDRAGMIGAAVNEARQRGIGRALGAAQGSIPNAATDLAVQQSALSGLSAANQAAMQRKEMQAKQQQGKGAGIGSIAGAIPWGGIFG